MVFCNRLFRIGKIPKTPRHNPYFNRWFSAIGGTTICIYDVDSHNPYFNRWFSAIYLDKLVRDAEWRVTILILIDGFLQLELIKNYGVEINRHNPYFNRWFSAIIAHQDFANGEIMSQSLF